MKLVFTLFLCVYSLSLLQAITYTTIAPGNWQDPQTWQSGNVPDPESIDGDQVIIQHNINILNNNIKLINGATMDVIDVTFNLLGGNLIIEDGTATFSNVVLYVESGWSIQQTTSDASLFIWGSSVDVGQNFQNSEGFRYLEDVCLIVDENYQNDKGIDSLINVCAIIGNSSSGSFQNNSNSLMYLSGSSFNILNGNFQNQSSALMAGDIIALWVQNGNLQNSGTWTLVVNEYCVSQQITVSNQFLPPVQTCNTIASFFNPCSCSGSNNTVLTSSALVSDAVCYGDSSAAIDLSVIGGQAPYTFVWSNAATTEDISNIVAGSYSVTITDANNDQIVANFNVTEAAALVSSVLINQTSCSNSTDASILLNLSGGTAPYGFLWSTGQTNQALQNVTAGSYSVTITDANACSIAANYSIPITNPIAVNLQPTAVSCEGSNDGFVQATVASGQAPYSYNWSNNTSNQAINNLAEGMYSLTVTDANGCTATESTVVVAPSIIELEVYIVNESCDSSGSITISNLVGGTPPYQVLWSNGSTNQGIYFLTAGMYSLTISDANNCSLDASYTLSLDSAQTCTIEPGDFRTQTQGGWGASCSGNNPGCYRDANFSNAFPAGLVLGCTFTVTFSSSFAVETYLPCGGPAAILNNSFTDPSCLNNVLLSQLLAASLSVGFDNYDAGFGNSSTALQDLLVAYGPMQGLTVGDVLDEANQLLGGCGSAFSRQDINATLSNINQNFVDGTMLDTALICQSPCSSLSSAERSVQEALVWPNPAKDELVYLQFELNNRAAIQLQIVEMNTGKILQIVDYGNYLKGKNTLAWDGFLQGKRSLNRGLYLLRVMASDKLLFNSKLIKL